MTNKNIQLSLLIPTYNEVDIIKEALEKIAAELGPDCATTEVIIVDDGKDMLPEVVFGLRLPFHSVEVLRNKSPLGKGRSLNEGFQRAQAPIAGFLDVDLSTPPRYIKLAVRAIQEGRADIFIGSRKIKGATVNREQFFLKDILGNALGVIARSIIFSGMRSYRDTQCGFKFYKTPMARVLYADLLAGDGLNDLEVLIRANLLDYRVEEMGVEWTDLRESKRSLRRILWGEVKAISKILVLYKIFRSERMEKLRAKEKSVTTY